MKTILIIIGVLINIFIWIVITLLPFYIAYNVIDPESFLGVVGTFILGSLIAPIAIGFLILLSKIIPLLIFIPFSKKQTYPSKNKDSFTLNQNYVEHEICSTYQQQIKEQAPNIMVKKFLKIEEIIIPIVPIVILIIIITVITTVSSDLNSHSDSSEHINLISNSFTEKTEEAQTNDTYEKFQSSPPISSHLNNQEILSIVYGLPNNNMIENSVQSLDDERLNELAKIIIKSNNYQKYNISQLFLMIAHKKNSFNLEYLENLAYISILMNDTRTAQIALNKVMQIKTNRPDTILHLARYEALNNQIQNCQNHLNHYIDLIGNDSKVLKIFNSIQNGDRDSQQFKNCVYSATKLLQASTSTTKITTYEKNLISQFISETEQDWNDFKFIANDYKVNLFDINNDGITDRIFEITICEETNCHLTTRLTKFTVLLGNHKGKYSLADTVIFHLGASITSIKSNGEFHIEHYDYADNDPTCCPSITNKNKYIFRNGKLILI